jgi:hypothetical protein
MQGMEISTIISAAPKFLGFLIKPIVSLVSYFSPPEMEVIEQPTKFGRLAGKEFALLLWVKFRNKSDKAVLVTSFEVKHAGAWYKPSEHPPEHVTLQNSEYVQSHAELQSNECITNSPRIPPADVINRFGFFILPESIEQWPMSIEVTVRSKFARRSSRSVTRTLSNY